MNIHLCHLRGIAGRRIAQQQHRQPHGRPPQLHRLLEIRDGQIIRPQLLQRMADLHGPVTVRIRLDDAQEPAAVCHMAPQLMIVIFQMVQIDFCPCPL